MYKLEASKLSLPSVSTGFAHLSVLLLKALLMRLLEGRLTRRIGRREHVLWIGSCLGPDHVVAGVVEVGHGRTAQAGCGEDGLIYCVFFQTSSGPTRHGRWVAVHRRACLQRKPIRRGTIKKWIEAQQHLN